MRCFITVGTTQFDELLQTAFKLEFLRVLDAKGYTDLCIQAGSSQVNEVILTEVKAELPNLNIEWFDYKPDILSHIADADLVISHAGAGSCLEIMHANRPCIVVINEKLMGNHQVELAEKLSALGHIKHTTPSRLVETLEEFDGRSLLPYEPGDPSRFTNHLHQLLGLDHAE